MARPTTKAELLDAAQAQYDALFAAVDDVASDAREVPGACDAWSVKDLLAHLHAWHEMTIGWERVGSAGGVPFIPAEGYTFAETPALNEVIHRRTRDDDWADVVERLDASHGQMMALIESYDADDLFTKKRYPWTKSTSVGAYLVSATSSHYAWASNLIRRWWRKAR